MRVYTFLVFTAALSGVYTAQLQFEQNPDCHTGCSDCAKTCPKENEPWLTYGTSIIGNKTFHFLWSAMKLPVFLIASSSLDSKMTIDWDRFQNGEPGSIQFFPIPDNVFGLSIQGLILFDDVHDTGKLDDIPEEDKIYIGLDKFNWKFSGFYNHSSNEIVSSFETVEFKNKSYEDSRISINLTTFGAEERGEELPHLFANINSAQLEISLDNLTFDPSNSSNHHLFGNKHHHKGAVPIGNFSHARWALDMIVISDERIDTSEMIFDYTSSTSLDDEYAPGVFTLNEVVSKMAARENSSDGGYMQWRPVCYLTTDNDINFSTLPNFNTSLPHIDKVHFNRARQSLLYALFGDFLPNLSGFQSTVAFGLSDDEFYTSFNYTKWTFSFGLGSPPNESFSTLVIIAISVGVGLPLLLFVAGGVFMLGRKVLKKKENGEILINEE